jgi:hypothetical protein
LKNLGILETDIELLENEIDSMENELPWLICLTWRPHYRVIVILHDAYAVQSALLYI